MAQYVISVFGPDRPGIIAEVSAVLAQVGANLEDSTMSVLRGRLAMMIVAQAPASQQEMAQAVQPLNNESLLVQVRPMSGLTHSTSVQTKPYVLSVYGADQLGIVSAITAAIAQAGGNITDLSTRLLPAQEEGGQQLYVLLADVDVPVEVSAQQLDADLALSAQQLGVHASLRLAESDVM